VKPKPAFSHDPRTVVLVIVSSFDVIQVRRNGGVSDEMLCRSFESLEEENIQNLEGLRRMRRVRNQENVMNRRFLQRLIGAMASAVVAKQNCGLSLASGEFPIARKLRDEDGPDLLQENFLCHRWRRLNFHSQIDSLSNRPFKDTQCHRSRTDEQRAVCIT
jgi:hypothetical protein